MEMRAHTRTDTDADMNTDTDADKDTDTETETERQRETQTRQAADATRARATIHLLPTSKSRGRREHAAESVYRINTRSKNGYTRTLAATYTKLHVPHFQVATTDTLGLAAVSITIIRVSPVTMHVADRR
jgi:hypothetical protein